MNATVVNLTSKTPGASELGNIVEFLQSLASTGRLRRVIAIAVDTDDNVSLLNDGGRKLEAIGLLTACQHLLLREEVDGQS